MTINLPTSRRTTVLTLGAESAGVFAVYHNGSIFMSKNFGDILVNTKFLRYKRAVLAHLAKEKIKPNVIITDLHPLYNSSIFGEELAKKYSTFGGSAVGGKITKLIKVQHHIAHIFSSVGDRLLLSTINYQLPTSFIGIAADGTGYGLDGNIWGGEVFKSQMSNVKCQKIRIERIGSLEEQTMIGGDLAVREPARMLIAILAKLKNQKPKLQTKNQKL
ncbi:hypothetical protein KKA96_01540 [Patescibacteria group bacterium]|nr:hypothetical protein [Patescibacteria group bacterium]